MKLPLKYFLLICLLLGTVAIPLGFRWYKSWKEKEVQNLNAQLSTELTHSLLLMHGRYLENGQQIRLDETYDVGVLIKNNRKQIDTLMGRIKNLGALPDNPFLTYQRLDDRGIRQNGQ